MTNKNYSMLEQGTSSLYTPFILLICILILSATGLKNKGNLRVKFSLICVQTPTIRSDTNQPYSYISLCNEKDAERSASPYLLSPEGPLLDSALQLYCIPIYCGITINASQIPINLLNKDPKFTITLPQKVGSFCLLSICASLYVQLLIGNQKSNQKLWCLRAYCEGFDSI